MRALQPHPTVVPCSAHVFSGRSRDGSCHAASGMRITYVFGALLSQLGKHTTGKGCLYVKKLADADLAVLEELVTMSWERMNATYPN